MEKSNTQRILDDIRRNAIIAEVYRCLAAGVQPSREICEEYRELTERKEREEEEE